MINLTVSDHLLPDKLLLDLGLNLRQLSRIAARRRREVKTRSLTEDLKGAVTHLPMRSNSF